MRRELTSYIQTRLTDFSNYRTSADMELTHIGALKTILSEVFLIAREQRNMRHDMQEILKIVKKNGSHLHEDSADRSTATAAEALSARPAVARQSTTSRHIEEAAALSALLHAIQGLGADINVIKLAVAANESTAAGKSRKSAGYPTASRSELNATVAAKSAGYPSASRSERNATVAAIEQHSAPGAARELALQTKPLQRSARNRAASTSCQGQRTAQTAGSPTPPPTLTPPPTNVHEIGSSGSQEMPRQAVGVPSTEPPSSTGKSSRTTATVLAVRAAAQTEGCVTFPTPSPSPNSMAIRQGGAETFPTSQGGSCTTPNSHPAAVWESFVLVPGDRQLLPFTCSVWQSDRTPSDQPMRWPFRPQKTRSASWAVALAAAVDNDQDMAQTAAW